MDSDQLANLRPNCKIEAQFQSCPNLQWGDIQRLLNLGIPALAIGVPRVLVKARVAFEGRYSFDFDEGGDIALIIPAIEDGVVADLCAWQPKSGRLASWLGHAKALGWGELYAPNLSGEPLKVWASPLGWLKAGRRGIVPIDIASVARSLVIWGDHVSAIVCENPEHGRAIKAAFTPKPPRVLTPRSTREAA